VITVGGFNTSVDKTLELDVLQPGAVHRVRGVQSWPGGKGLHVALTVAALGEPVHLVGLIDAAHRCEFESALRARGVAFTGVDAKGALRTCLALRDQQGARITEILEPGPHVDADTREELCARFLALERFQSREIDLQVSRAGVMNVLIAGIPAKGERTEMSTKIAETQENKQVAGPGAQPKAPKKANAVVALTEHLLCAACLVWRLLRASCRPVARQCRRRTTPTNGASGRLVRTRHDAAPSHAEALSASRRPNC